MKNYNVFIQYTKKELHTVKATSIARAIAIANGKIFERKNDGSFTNISTEITDAAIARDDLKPVVTDICLVSENVFAKRSK